MQQQRDDDDRDSSTSLLVKLMLLVVVTSYLVKYGELGWDVPLQANPHVAVSIVVGIPSLTALYFATLSMASSSIHPAEEDEERRPLQASNHANGYYGSQEDPITKA